MSTTNATITYDGVAYPIGLHYPMTTKLSLGMLKVSDSQNLIFWRDKTSLYDKIDSSLKLTIDGNIKELQNILVGRIDAIANPLLKVEEGVYPFSPLYDNLSNTEIGISKTKYSRAKNIQQRWNEYELSILPTGGLIENTTLPKCGFSEVWTLNNISLPNPKLSTNPFCEP